MDVTNEVALDATSALEPYAATKHAGDDLPSIAHTYGGVFDAAASGALVLFLLASFLAVVALDVGGGPKEGTSGDQLRDYVEVGYIFNFRMGNLSDVVF